MKVEILSILHHFPQELEENVEFCMQRPHVIPELSGHTLVLTALVTFPRAHSDHPFFIPDI
jgi:hypothetical protein